MTAIDYVLGGILLAAALFLVVAVLMQSGKSHGLSGSIAGGAETFFGKTKGKTLDRVFSKLTTIIAIIFVIIVIVVYVMQPNANTDEHDHDHADEVTVADTTADVGGLDNETDATPDETDTGVAETDTGAAESDTVAQ